MKQAQRLFRAPTRFKIEKSTSRVEAFLVRLAARAAKRSSSAPNAIRAAALLSRHLGAQHEQDGALLSGHFEVARRTG
jgi:hypothetical protein